ncbi:Patched domain-containing protein 3 [Trichostrongylus colubriformis]|uniref:Patched domain-containing protein 3 n=1 Tax=Trichostrongylus colubriformis TaxID=6319 RepID=A0AAN8FVT6_TRICO
MLACVNPFGVLQDFLARCFHDYGLFISRYPRAFALGPLILTCILALGTFNVRMEDDLRFLYSPEHSRSRLEYQIHKNFSGATMNSSFVSVTLESMDHDKNLLTPEKCRAIRKLNKFIMENLTMTMNGRQVNFGQDVCPKLKHCTFSNTIADIFLDSFFNKKLQGNPRIKIEYPTMTFYENKLFLPTHLYGVRTDNENNIKSFDMVHLIYDVPSYENVSSEDVSAAFTESLRNLLDSGSVPFKSSIFSLSILKEEMQKNATYTIPFISLTILLLVSFTVGSCMTGDWITSKPIEAMIGVLTSSMAIVSAGGLLFALGEPFIYQVTVMPFIALAIGVDDVYVMLGAWQDTRRTLAPEKRMALALEEAGSAISVTSITSILSFGIGSFSSTPAISIFCKFIMVAVAFDWFYQLTFFAAVMVLGARREAAGYHCIFVWKRCDKAEREKAKSSDTASPSKHFFSNIFAPIICHPVTRIIIIVVYGIYVLLAFYGCAQLEPNLTPSRLVVDDSPLVHYLHLAENKIWAEGLIGRVYVNRAPDIKNPREVARMLDLVGDLESTPYSMGSNSTSFWLKDFNNYKQYFTEDNERLYSTLKAFLKVSFNNHWEADIQWTNHTDEKEQRVEKFVFTTAFKIESWSVRTELLLMWRNITSQYPEFEAFVFDENNFYSDQMLELQTTTLQSLGTAILTLIGVCILFVAESSIVFWVTFSLVSMDVGTAGFLSLWGADLDPTTVVNILMSIGQCIDFATHVGYRIYRSEHSDPNDRIRDALGAIAWPVLQAGSSTLLAIVVMILVPSNAVRMFARTSVLVVATGLFHGLLVLPVVIRTFASHAKAHVPHHRDESTNKASISGRFQ